VVQLAGCCQSRLFFKTPDEVYREFFYLPVGTQAKSQDLIIGLLQMRSQFNVKRVAFWAYRTVFYSGFDRAVRFIDMTTVRKAALPRKTADFRHSSH
jgi:hypothetical protein